MRAASLAFAGAASLIGLIFPFWLARQATDLNQTILLVLMAGIMGAFIYGAGFAPQNRTARWAISPGVTWPLLAGSLGALLIIR
jgi:predicted membrane protein